MTDNTQIHLLFCCRAIKPVDILSQRQFYLRVSLNNLNKQGQNQKTNQNQNTFHFQVIGQTQRFKGTANPNFLTQIKVVYHFSTIQQLKVQLLEVGKQQTLAEYNTTLDALLGSMCETIITKFYNKKQISQGRLLIRANTDKTTHYQLYMKWRGGNIANVDSIFDFWDKSDPYLKFMKVKKQSSFQQVAKTEPIIDSLQPNWKPITISANLLEWDPKNPQSVFRIQCWDYQEKDQNHQLIGFIYVENQKLQSQDLPVQFSLRNSHIKKPGKLFLDQFFYIQPLLSFLNIIRSGIKIDLLTVTDFTKHKKIQMKQQSDNLLCFKFFSLLWKKIENFNLLKQFESYGFRGNSLQQVFFPLHTKNKNMESIQNLSNHYFKILSNLDNFQNSIKLSLTQILIRIKQILMQKKQNVTNPYLFTICSIILNGYNVQNQAQNSNNSQNIIELLAQFKDLPVYIIIADLSTQSHLQKIQSLYRQYLIKEDKNSILPLKQVHFAMIKYQQYLLKIMQALLSEFPKFTQDYLKRHKIGVNALPQMKIQQLFPNINPLKDNKIFMTFGCKHIAVDNLDQNQGLYLKIYLKKNINGNLQYLDRTEIIEHTLNPVFKAQIDAAFIFQMKQSMKIELYRTSDIQQKRPIGTLDTSLTQIIGNPFQTFVTNFVDQNLNQVGKIGIRVQKHELSEYQLKMTWRGSKIANVDSFFDFWDKSDPYLRFLRNKGTNVYVPVAETQIIPNNLQPNWKQISISSKKLGLDMKNPLSGFRIQCWDFQVKAEDHQIIGDVYITLNDIKNKKCPISFPLANQKQQKVGTLILQQIQFIQPPLSFMNVIKSGLQLNLIIAMDLSIPKNQQSRHSHLKSSQQNVFNTYKKSVLEIVSNIWSVVQKFNTKKLIFGYGFQQKGQQKQAFNKEYCLPLNNPNSQIQGFQRFAQILSQHLQKNKIKYSDQIQLAPVLKKILQDLQEIDLQKSVKNKNLYQYNIVVIIVNQVNSDLKQFIDIVVKNCIRNVSIAIVGIKQIKVNFRSLQKYNKEQAVMNRQEVSCPRDMIQFMEFTHFYKGQQKMFAFDLLKRVSWQIIDYYKKSGIGVSPQNQPPFQQLLNLRKKSFFSQQSGSQLSFSG